MDKIRSLTGMPDYSEKSEKDNVAAKLFHVENSLKDIAEIDAAIKGLSDKNPWQSIRDLALNF